MSWREHYQQASFRGIPFQVRSSDVATGRRVVVHEYPHRNLIFAEDLGLKARKFTLEAYVVGSDYLPQRDVLIAALERPGPGTLVHPYYVVRQVVCTEVSIKETAEEGGQALFSITFVDAGQQVYPLAAPDKVARTESAANALSQSAQQKYLNSITLKGPQLIRDNLSTAIRSLGGYMRRLDIFSGLSKEAAYYQKQIQNLTNEAGYLANAPVDFVSRLTQSIKVIGANAQNARSAFYAYQTASPQALVGALSLTGAPVLLAAGSTNFGQMATNNAFALTTLASQLVLAEGARYGALAADNLEFESLNEAIAAQHSLTTQIDFQAATADDSMYSNLQTLRTEVVNSIPSDPQSLPRISYFTPYTTQPALVLAYDLYEDTTRETDLVRRNNIRYPGFIEGGQPLEVLIHV